MDKIATLSESKPLVVDTEEQKQSEMELVDATQFEDKVCAQVEQKDLEEIYALAGEMVKFAHARGAVGLTLPQIGVMKRGFVFLSKENEWEVLLNPEYFAKGKKAAIYERSLSWDGVYGYPRFKNINAVFYTIDIDEHDRLFMKKNFRKMSGLKAMMYQNLVDMLDGKTSRKYGVKVNPKDVNLDAEDQQP